MSGEVTNNGNVLRLSTNEISHVSSALTNTVTNPENRQIDSKLDNLSQSVLTKESEVPKEIGDKKISELKDSAPSLKGVVAKIKLAIAAFFGKFSSADSEKHKLNRLPAHETVKFEGVEKEKIEPRQVSKHWGVDDSLWVPDKADDKFTLMESIESRAQKARPEEHGWIPRSGSDKSKDLSSNVKQAASQEHLGVEDKADDIKVADKALVVKSGARFLSDFGDRFTAKAYNAIEGNVSDLVQQIKNNDIAGATKTINSIKKAFAKVNVGNVSVDLNLKLKDILNSNFIKNLQVMPEVEDDFQVFKSMLKDENSPLSGLIDEADSTPNTTVSSGESKENIGNAQQLIKLLIEGKSGKMPVIKEESATVKDEASALNENRALTDKEAEILKQDNTYKEGLKDDLTGDQIDSLGHNELTAGLLAGLEPHEIYQYKEANPNKLENGNLTDSGLKDMMLFGKISAERRKAIEKLTGTNITAGALISILSKVK